PAALLPRYVDEPLTWPPLRTFKVPLPLLPTVKSEPLVHVEPAPVTVAELVDVPLLAIQALRLAIWPPPLTFSVPLPLEPTNRFRFVIQFEPTPLTDTIPVDPAFWAMTLSPKAPLTFAVAPVVTFIVPAPLRPTMSSKSDALEPVTLNVPALTLIVPPEP